MFVSVSFFSLMQLELVEVLEFVDSCISPNFAHLGLLFIPIMFLLLSLIS